MALAPSSSNNWGRDAPDPNNTYELPDDNWQYAGDPSQPQFAGTEGQHADPRLTGFLLDPRYTQNPKFDHRMQNTGHMQGKMPRGRIALAEREETELYPGVGKHIRACNFLFNPSQITQSYEFSTQIPINPDPNDKSVPTMSGQAIRFQLFFDRTFELAYRRSGGPAAEMGVLADIGAFENLARANFGRPVAGIPVIVSFGASWQGAPWSFYGWITQFDVVYTQFTVRMMPARASIDVTLTRRWSEDAMGVTANAPAPAAPVQRKSGTTPSGQPYWTP